MLTVFCSYTFLPPLSLPRRPPALWLSFSLQSSQPLALTKSLRTCSFSLKNLVGLVFFRWQSLQALAPRTSIPCHRRSFSLNLKVIWPKAWTMFPPRPPSYCRNDRVRSFNPKSDFAFQLNFLFVCQISYIIAVSTLKTGPRYFSLFLMLGGLFGSYNVALAVSTFTLF